MQRITDVAISLSPLELLTFAQLSGSRCRGDSSSSLPFRPRRRPLLRPSLLRHRALLRRRRALRPADAERQAIHLSRRARRRRSEAADVTSHRMRPDATLGAVGGGDVGDGKERDGNGNTRRYEDVY